MAAQPAAAISPTPPPAGLTLTISEPLASDMRAHFDTLAADHLRYGFKHVSFEQWVESVFKDRVYRVSQHWPEENR